MAADRRMDDLVRLCPLTALAVAADLPEIPADKGRMLTGLSEEELMRGYGVTGDVDTSKNLGLERATP